MKDAMLAYGKTVMETFCVYNAMPSPEVVAVPSTDWQVNACAYYRKNVTRICTSRCASIGTAGMQWSFPGYTVDRTPYGVIQHELGHHVDWNRSTRKGNYYGDFGMRIREASGEKPITSYCPDDAEWFAEMFRLFVTNPDLLRHVRHRTHRELSACFNPVFTLSWRAVLRGAPERTIKAAERKIEEAK